jgi:outer membrane protein OmpA-like peptidoglycan-associated protein
MFVAMARPSLITLLLAILLGGGACGRPMVQGVIENTPKDLSLVRTTVEVEDQPYVIYFEPASATITNRFQPILTDIAAALKTQPNWRIDIQGYSDDLENRGYNLDLSKRRAGAVRQVLVKQYQVAASRLNVVDFGSATSKARASAMRAQNRRVEFELVRRPQMQQTKFSAKAAEMIASTRTKLRAWTNHTGK